MNSKILEKNKAVKLRKSGFAYSEILKQVLVSKSTLSIWLRDVGLSKPQKHILTEKKRLAALRGAEARKRNRIALVNDIQIKAIKEVGKISDRDLWLIGIALYWAEGAKEKEWRPGSGFKFTNSDPLMIKLFLKWLLKSCNLSKERIYFSISIHEIYRPKFNQIKKYWSEITNFPIFCFNRIYLKKHTIKTNRKNIGDMYNGVLTICVTKSSELTRQVSGWVMGIVK